MHISAESVCRSVFAPDLIATNYKKLKSYLKTDKQKCERNHLKQPKNHLKNLFQLNTNPKLVKTFYRPNVNTVFKGELSGPVVCDSALSEKYKEISTLEKFKEDIKQ